MTRTEIDEAKRAWPSLSKTVHVPHTEDQYRALVTLLDKLVDEAGEDEKHPLASLMEVIGVLIKKYEDESVPELVLQIRRALAASKGVSLPAGKSIKDLINEGRKR